MIASPCSLSLYNPFVLLSLFCIPFSSSFSFTIPFSICISHYNLIDDGIMLGDDHGNGGDYDGNGGDYDGDADDGNGGDGNVDK